METSGKYQILQEENKPLTTKVDMNNSGRYSMGTSIDTYLACRCLLCGLLCCGNSSNGKETRGGLGGAGGEGFALREGGEGEVTASEVEALLRLHLQLGDR